DEAGVAEAAGGGALAGELELRGRAVDGDDAIEERREDLEEGAVAGAGVDGELAAREERRERTQVACELLRWPRPGAAAAPREELARLAIARRDHVGHALERSVGLAEGGAGLERVGDDRIGARVRIDPQEQPGALFAAAEQARVAEGARLARHLRLALA